MGVAERRAREKEELRNTILEAARELFVVEGYEAVSMRKLAEKIEYSPTAIYLHFRDKDALFRELCGRDYLRLAERFQHLSGIADPVERFRQVGLAYVDFALAHPNHYRLMFMTPHPAIEPDPDLVQKGNPEQDAYAFLKSILADAVAAGRLRPEYGDVDRTAQIAWAAVHGIVSLHIAKGRDAWIEWRPARQAAELLIDTVVRGMTTGASAAAGPSASGVRPRGRGRG